MKKIFILSFLSLATLTAFSQNFATQKSDSLFQVLKKKDKFMGSSNAIGYSDLATAKCSNSNYVLLSYILQKAYKKDYASILNEKILRPVGLKHTYFGTKKTNILNNESYSYHFKNEWIKEDETDLSIPMGAGALIACYPEEKLAIAISSNGSIYKIPNILACAESCNFNRPFEIPTFEKLAVASEILDTFYLLTYLAPEENFN